MGSFVNCFILRGVGPEVALSGGVGGRDVVLDLHENSILWGSGILGSAGRVFGAEVIGEVGVREISRGCDPTTSGADNGG